MLSRRRYIHGPSRHPGGTYLYPVLLTHARVPHDIALTVIGDPRARPPQLIGCSTTTTRILRLAGVTSIDALADIDLASLTAQHIRRKGVALGRSASAEAIRDVVLGRDPIGASARRPQTDVGMQERPASTPSVQVMVGPQRRSNG